MTIDLFTSTQAVSTIDQPRLSVKTIALVGDRSLAMDLTHVLAKGELITVRYWEALEQLAAHPQAIGETTLVVGLSACYHPAFDRRVQRWCREQGVAFLRIGIWQHEVVIGPFVLPDQPGCVACAEIRRIRALTTEATNELHFLAWCEDVSLLQGRAPNPWLTDNARQIISLTAASDIETFIQHGTPAMGLQTVRFLRLRSLTNRCHTFLPDPCCEICAQTPDDCAEDAVLHFQPRLRLNPSSYRVRSILNEVAALEKRYVDHRLGLQIRGLHGNGTTFATTVTRYFEYPNIKQDTSATGIAYSFQASRATAILEALERSSGFLPNRNALLSMEAMNNYSNGRSTRNSLVSLQSNRTRRKSPVKRITLYVTLPPCHSTGSGPILCANNSRYSSLNRSLTTVHKQYGQSMNNSCSRHRMAVLWAGRWKTRPCMDSARSSSATPFS